MMRVLLAVLLLSAVAVAVAAPVPKASRAERLKLLFGEPVDPDAEFDFALYGNRLRVEVPEGVHRVGTGGNHWPAARTSRVVSGDFVTEVTVHFRFPVGAGRADAHVHPMAGAGLVAWHSEENFVSYLFGGQLPVRPGGVPLRDPTPGLHFTTSRVGQSSTTWAIKPEWKNVTTVRLRMVRREDTITRYFRRDRREWEELSSSKAPNLGPRLNVGVVVEHSLTAPVAAEFEDFTVTPVKPGK